MIDRKSNSMWAYPDWVDEAPVAWAGGSWSATAGLEQLDNPYLNLRARSTDATLASTVIDFDLGLPCMIRNVIGLGHNLGRSARRRLSLYSDAEMTSLVARLDWDDVFPVIYAWGSLPWEHPSWWDGRLEARLAERYPMPIRCVLDAPALARYGRLELDDETNAAGYVELGRLIIAGGIQPTGGVSVSNDLQWADDLSRVSVTAGGAVNVIERPRGRTLSISIENLMEDEVMSTLFDMAGVLGKTRSFYFMLAPRDAINFHRKSGLFRFEAPPRHPQRRRLRRDTNCTMIEVTA